MSDNIPHDSPLGRLVHEFDSSWTCNYCGIAEEKAKPRELCPKRSKPTLNDHGPQKSLASVVINPPPNPFFQFVYSWPMNGGQANLSFPAPGGIVQSGSMATLEKMFELILDAVRKSQADVEQSTIDHEGKIAPTCAADLGESK